MHSLRALPVATLCLAALLPLASAHAQDEETKSTMPGELTGNVSLNSDYMYRGISQTSNGAAVMGSADWAFGTGFHDTQVYVGIFAANVDFPGSNANLETDFAAGLRGSSHKFDWDVGVTYFKYFGASSSLDMNYYEFGGKVSRDLGFASVSAQAGFSPEYTGKTGTEYYLGGRVEKSLPYDLTAFASLGHQWVNDNQLAGIPDYYDWSAGLTLPIWKFNVTAAYTDTNISKGGCYARAYGNVCTARATVSVGIDF